MAAGTSFSSPRVAAALAGLRRQYPRVGNQALEELLLRELCHPLKGAGPVLDVPRVRSLFSAGQ